MDAGVENKPSDDREAVEWYAELEGGDGNGEEEGARSLCSTDLM